MASDVRRKIAVSSKQEITDVKEPQKTSSLGFKGLKERHVRLIKDPGANDMSACLEECRHLLLQSF